jgi:hypothetical protein
LYEGCALCSHQYWRERERERESGHVEKTVTQVGEWTETAIYAVPVDEWTEALLDDIEIAMGMACLQSRQAGTDDHRLYPRNPGLG